MIKQQNKELIELTKKQFGDYYQGLSDEDAQEIIDNFGGFAKLLIELEQRRLEGLNNVQS